MVQLGAQNNIGHRVRSWACSELVEGGSGFANWPACARLSASSAIAIGCVGLLMDEQE